MPIVEHPVVLLVHERVARRLRRPAVGSESPRSDRAGEGLRLVNAAGALFAVGYAAAGVWRSAGPRGRAALSEAPGEARFWAAQSAVRTWAVAVPLLLTIARARPAPAVLVVAGLVQLGDSAVGLWCRRPGMTVTPALMGLVHLATARRQIAEARAVSAVVAARRSGTR